MARLEPLSAHISVAGQIQPDDLAALSAAGFTSVINNRPDDEEPGQPSSADIEVAAHAAGLSYLHVPVRGLPDEQAVAAVADRLEADASAGVRTVLFCRSGMRSAAVWAMARSAGGDNPADLRAAAAEAGYDLGRVPL